ncbi:MAG: VanW family protein, partial [Providencia sp.]
MRRPLSTYHPILYWLRVRQKRFVRRLHWTFSTRQYARKRDAQRLEYRYNKHTSKLIRKLGNSDLKLQHNKVINLRIASDAMNGIVIR